jgi:hypothetical protein
MFAVGTFTMMSAAETESDPVVSVTSTDGSVWTAAAPEHTWYTSGSLARGTTVTVVRRSGQSEVKTIE